MKVLVLGGSGYIGSVLADMLVEKGFETAVFGRFSGSISIFSDIPDKLEIIQGDVRNFDPENMAGVDAVIDMITSAYDATGDKNPELTMEINYREKTRMAKLAKEHKVSRYLLATPCAVYGFSQDPLTENSELRPQTTYAKAGAMCEKDDLSLSNEDFAVTSMRLPSVYGISRVMRFNMAVNAMVLRLFKDRKLSILRDGKQYRSFVNIKDAANSFIVALQAEKELVNKQIFNVGSNDQNITIFNLAKLITESVGLPFVYDWYGEPSFHSYMPNYDKIGRVLAYKTQHTIPESAKEMFDALKDGNLTPPGA